MKFEVIRKLFNIKQDDGFSENDINKACEKYGCLPFVLKEYYRQLGNCKEINQAFNSLCPPSRLIDVKDYLIFYVENQYVAQWAIKKSDLSKDNPPVYCSLDETDFKLESNSLLDFLYAMAFFQAACWGLEYYCEEMYILNEQQAQIIKARYKKKDYELHQWFNISYYGNYDDEVICIVENSDMHYASSSKEHFNEMKKFIDSLELETY